MARVTAKRFYYIFCFIVFLFSFIFLVVVVAVVVLPSIFTVVTCRRILLLFSLQLTHRFDILNSEENEKEKRNLMISLQSSDIFLLKSSKDRALKWTNNTPKRKTIHFDLMARCDEKKNVLHINSWWVWSSFFPSFVGLLVCLAFNFRACFVVIGIWINFFPYADFERIFFFSFRNCMRFYESNRALYSNKKTREKQTLMRAGKCWKVQFR